MSFPTARVEQLFETGVHCAWNRHGRISFRRSACVRNAGWRCIVRPIGRKVDKPARRYCTEHARLWARQHHCEMPLVCELHARPHWMEARDA